MKPISYKKQKNKIIFEYSKDDLEKFHKLGKSEGNVGYYLHSVEDDKYFIYKAYGTIEAPVKEEMTITLLANPLLDKKFNLEAFMNPQEKELNDKDFKFEIFDFGKTI